MIQKSAFIMMHAHGTMINAEIKPGLYRLQVSLCLDDTVDAGGASLAPLRNPQTRGINETPVLPGNHGLHMEPLPDPHGHGGLVNTGFLGTGLLVNTGFLGTGFLGSL